MRSMRSLQVVPLDSGMRRVTTMTWGLGWGCGVVGLWGCGVVGSWGRGVVGSWGHEGWFVIYSRVMAGSVSISTAAVVQERVLRQPPPLSRIALWAPHLLPPPSTSHAPPPLTRTLGVESLSPCSSNLRLISASSARTCGGVGGCRHY